LIGLVNFYLIKDYPFVSVGDELRDSGLDAMKIANGEIKNLFAYGNYNGYGRIIPTFSSFFYRLFENSVLAYRLPAALISFLDIIIFYFLLCFVTKKKLVAFIGALVLCSLPHHFYFSRTELVVIFSSFWTSILLLFFYLWVKKRKPANYIFLGIGIGVACQFHTSVRIIALLLLLFAMFFEIKSVVGLGRLVDKREILLKAKKILLLFFFCFIGFGPTILYSNSSTFFQRNRFAFADEHKQISYRSIEDKIKIIKENYLESLMVLVYEPTTSRYLDHKPLLNPLLSVFLLIGIGYSFFILKDGFYNSLILLLFILPFTNSAMTDWVNADHRLMPLLPILAVLVTLGFLWIIQKARSRPVRMIFVVWFTIYLLFQICLLFINFPANKGKNIKDYLSMYTVYFLQSKEFSDLEPFPGNDLSGNGVCLFLSETNYQNLSLLHYLEQYQYFVPHLLVERKIDKDITDNRVYIFKGDCPESYQGAVSRKVVSCFSTKNLYCPLGYIGEITIYY